ncbi:baseplate J/gp47 family protein [Bacillus horti]|uniref:Baseplate assembly protein n=1 Tax=Caldalkalibacillus horti TaxID=77523 RepID=A0ABT9VZZ1_9BACI|nr:baseplate J/gp47 family protein [Bacillus horti]MDQ0166568.1 hypothetical protein [Bacillus horti]
MLKLPHLDDRMYTQIVEEARKRIPTLTDEWTDQNAHDPGITLMELFSWLIEMQQYHLDQITSKHERKYLKLMGMIPQPAQPASVDVFLSGVDRKIFLPQGTKFGARDQIFETLEEQWLLPVEVDKVLVWSKGEGVDYSIANDHVGSTYFAFGDKAEKGNRLYLSFQSELPVNEIVRLSFSLYESYPVSMIRGKHDPVAIPPGRISLFYYGRNNDHGTDWLPVVVEQDQTNHLSYSGSIDVKLPTQMVSRTVHPADDKKRYWLYAQVDQSGYELSPRIDKLEINTVRAQQTETVCHYQNFSSTGQGNQAFLLKHYLHTYGKLDVQVYEEQGWRDWCCIQSASEGAGEENTYELQEVPHNLKQLVFRDDHHRRVPEQGRNNIRVLAYESSNSEAVWLGRSNGLPYQRFELPRKGEGTYLQRIEIQVGFKEIETNEWIWQDWIRVADFDQSGLNDRHYILDPEGKFIQFGNHEQGLIPPKSEERNIRITFLQFGGGERGNIKSGVLDHIIVPTQQAKAVNEHKGKPLKIGGNLEGSLGQVTAINFYDARGGQEAESIEAAKKRLLNRLRQPTRTVTNSDIEALAKRTPGVRVARVKAIPLYVKGLQNYPQEKVAGQVTIVAVPFSEQELPVPSTGFLQTIKQHLEPFRLLTTQLHVISPEYIKVSVYAVLVVDPEVKDTGRVMDTLHTLLNPYDHFGEEGWDFGKAVTKAEMISHISKVSGVVYVQDIWLNGEGGGTVKNSNGDIVIPPHALVYSGQHDITLIGRQEL